MEVEVLNVRRPGRPRKVDALTNAERQRAYRARRRDAVVTVTNSAGRRDGQLAASDRSLSELQAWNARYEMWTVERNEMIEEVLELKAELAEARRVLDEREREIIVLNVRRDRLEFVAAEQRAYLASAREAIDNYKVELFKVYHGGAVRKTVTRKGVTKKAIAVEGGAAEVCSGDSCCD